MSTKTPSKINELVSNWPAGLVYTQKYLSSLGYSSDLVHRYIRSGWLIAMGGGAYRKHNDLVTWSGGLSAIQNQLGKQIYAGGKTALALQGVAHYGRANESSITLFTSQSDLLPKWFVDYPWDAQLDLTGTAFLKSDEPGSYVEILQGGYSINVSSPERAILEILYQIPRKQGFDEVYKLMEMLPSLRPDLLQQLLSSSHSVKVNRLFCFMAEAIGHPWFGVLDLSQVKLGSGKREIVKGGKLNTKYKITVPREYFG